MRFSGLYREVLFAALRARWGGARDLEWQWRRRPMDNNKVWIGIATGAGIGVAYALTARNKKSRWDRWDTREMTQRLADNREDLLERGKSMMERIRVIYEEGRKVVDDANKIWNQGRKMVRA